MYDLPSDNGRPWVPVLTGILAGLSIAALALTLFLIFKAPALLRQEAVRLLAEEPELLAPAWSARPAVLPTGSQLIVEGRYNAVVAAVEKVAPAVVAIVGTQVERYTVRPRSIIEFFELFGRPQVYERDIPSMGSGVLVSPYGRVVTNYHVVEGAQRIGVTLSDGRQFPARLLDVSSKHDIALLELIIPEGEMMPYAELGDSDDLLIGEWVIAIGSPFGFQLNDVRPSVTVGVISATNREVRPGRTGLYTDMIQTDAAINPGNSGGPLVNSEGQVIGINTLIFTRDGGSLGMGFARPINKVSWVLNEFEKYGKVRDTWAGFEAMNLRPFHVVHYNLKTRSGIFVTKVFKGGPADGAGLMPGDVVTAIGDQPVRSLEDGNLIFFRYEVGERVELTVNRDGSEEKINVVLEAFKED